VSGEKTFAPTEKRRRDAALKGDVLRSRELATAVAVLAGAAWLRFAGPWMLDRLAAATRGGLSWDRAALDDFNPGAAMLALLWALLPPLLVLAAGVLLTVGVTQLAMADGRWVGANALPKASRLSPLSGFKRMFGAQGWIEVAKGLLKIGLLGAIAWYWARGRLEAAVLRFTTSSRSPGKR
jgi:flagellar biosynthetic protein FlhB